MRVESVDASPKHSLRKPAHLSIRLLGGLGVEGDAHAGDAIEVELPATPHRSLQPV